MHHSDDACRYVGGLGADMSGKSCFGSPSLPAALAPARSWSFGQFLSLAWNVESSSARAPRLGCRAAGICSFAFYE